MPLSAPEARTRINDHVTVEMPLQGSGHSSYRGREAQGQPTADRSERPRPDRGRERQRNTGWTDIAAEFMAAIVNAFDANKRLADRAIQQVPEDKLHVTLDANTTPLPS